MEEEEAEGSRHGSLLSIHLKRIWNHVRGDSPPSRPASAVDNVLESKPGLPVVVLNRITMLQMVVRDIEKMNTTLREEDSPPPTVKEQCIIGLICGHVELDIFLAQLEANSKFLEVCDDEEFKLEELRKGLEKRDLGTGLRFWDLNWEFNSVEGSDGNPYGSLANCMIHELCNGWYDTYESLYNAESSRKCHHQVHDLVEAEPIKPIDMGIKGAGQKKDEGLSSYSNAWSVIEDAGVMSPLTGVSGENGVVPSKKLSDSISKTREESLLEILRRLEYTRLMRAYVPPSNIELNCYREIRKWISSAISYIMAKANNQEMRYICTGTRTWYSLFSDLLSPAAPRGHKLAIALDRLPEFLCLLRTYKEHLLKICSSSSVEKGATDVVDCVGDITLGIGDDALSQDWEVKKKRKHDTCITQYGNNKREIFSCIADNGSNESSSTSIREKNLLKILSLFLKIETLGVDECPTFQEVRLYAQVLEHVYLSIWMFKGLKYVFNSVNDGLEYVFNSVNDDGYWTKENIESGNSSNQVHYLSECLMVASAQMWMEEKTRLQYLEEAVCLVQAIKASYTCTPPTVREMVLYSELNKHITEDFLRSGFNWKHGSPDPDDVKGASEGEVVGTPEEIALLKHMLKAIYDKEIEILNMVGKEREDVEKAAQGLKEEGFDDTCPAEWDFLCRILLVIDQVTQLISIFTGPVDAANEYLDDLMYSTTKSRSYSCVACEVHNALIAVSQLDC